MADLQIDPEAINRYVAEQIIESAIGEQLRAVIDDQIKKHSSSYYDNPMKHVVAAALQQEAREYLATPEIKARLRAKVEEGLTDELIDTLITQIGQKVY